MKRERDSVHLKIPHKPLLHLGIWEERITSCAGSDVEIKSIFYFILCLVFVLYHSFSTNNFLAVQFLLVLQLLLWLLLVFFYYSFVWRYQSVLSTISQQMKMLCDVECNVRLVCTPSKGNFMFHLHVPLHILCSIPSPPTAPIEQLQFSISFFLLHITAPKFEV